MATSGNSESNKIYTWEFRFINPETKKEDSTQFCASTMEEAMKLFTEWCAKDMRFVLYYKPSGVCVLGDMKKDCSVVYNEEDAKEYGENYGSPEDFLSRA